MTVKINDPNITINPVIFVVFISNPYPRSIIKCLISLKIWKEKDQVIPKIINFPINEFKNEFIDW